MTSLEKGPTVTSSLFMGNIIHISLTHDIRKKDVSTLFQDSFKYVPSSSVVLFTCSPFFVTDKNLFAVSEVAE